MSENKLQKLNVSVASWILLGLVVFSPHISFGQQEPQFSQHMFNKLSYNAAHAGSNGATCITGFYRSQWLGLQLSDISGAKPSIPTTFNVALDLPIRFLHGGMGVLVMSDQIGFREHTAIKLAYAYRLQFPTGNLAFGLETEFLNSSTDFSKWYGADQFDENDQVNSSSTDPILMNRQDASAFVFDLGFGVYYQIPGKMYVGLSTTKLLQTASDKIYWQNKRHIYLMAGYDWTVPAYPNWRLLPSMLLKTELSSSQLDLALLTEYDHRFFGGLSYRLQHSVSVMGGLSWGNMKLGLSYDINVSSLPNVGSVEMFLRYCFKIVRPPKPPTINNNTRYM